MKREEVQATHKIKYLLQKKRIRSAKESVLKIASLTSLKSYECTIKCMRAVEDATHSLRISVDKKASSVRNNNHTFVHSNVESNVNSKMSKALIKFLSLDFSKDKKVIY